MHLTSNALILLGTLLSNILICYASPYALEEDAAPSSVIPALLPRASDSPRHRANGRARLYLYHATCLENVESVAMFPAIPNTRGDFTYRGGFYLTSNLRQARNYAVCYLSCEEGLAVIRYVWNGRTPTHDDVRNGFPSTAPSVLDLDRIPRQNGHRAASVFWEEMNQIWLYSHSNLPLPAHLQLAKNSHDSAHMITGTLPLNNEQTTCGMRASDGDFSQYVIVGAGASGYLRYDCHYKLNSDGTIYQICNPRSNQPVAIFPDVPDF